MSEGLALAQEYHRNLPQRIRSYLQNERGISDAVIDRYLLGWNGSRITIPVFDSRGDFAFFKLARDPEDKTDSPKMLATPGAHAELYDWQTALAKPESLSAKASLTGWCWKLGRRILLLTRVSRMPAFGPVAQPLPSFRKYFILGALHPGASYDSKLLPFRPFWPRFSERFFGLTNTVSPQNDKSWLQSKTSQLMVCLPCRQPSE